MSHDLILGFRKRPADLEAVMKKLGFTFRSSRGPDSTFTVKRDNYTLFNKEGNPKGIYASYSHGLYGDEEWNKIVPKVKIVSQALLDRSFNLSNSEIREFNRIGRFLRDHYNAVLYDPQSDKLLCSRKCSKR